jgi:hypothetical protein
MNGKSELDVAREANGYGRSRQGEIATVSMCSVTAFRSSLRGEEAQIAVFSLKPSLSQPIFVVNEFQSKKSVLNDGSFVGDCRSDNAPYNYSMSLGLASTEDQPR